MNDTYELQMPSSYVLIDEEEMEYLDGGGVPNTAVKVAIYAVFAAVGIGTGWAASKALRGAGGKYLAKKSIKNLAGKLGIGMSMGSVVVSKLVDFLVNVFDPVSMLTDKLDKLDGSRDGWVAGKGWGTWRGLSLRNW